MFHYSSPLKKSCASTNISQTFSELVLHPRCCTRRFHIMLPNRWFRNSETANACPPPHLAHIPNQSGHSLQLGLNAASEPFSTQSSKNLLKICQHHTRGSLWDLPTAESGQKWPWHDNRKWSILSRSSGIKSLLYFSLTGCGLPA